MLLNPKPSEGRFLLSATKLFFVLFKWRGSLSRDGRKLFSPSVFCENVVVLLYALGHGFWSNRVEQCCDRGCTTFFSEVPHFRSLRPLPKHDYRREKNKTAERMKIPWSVGIRQEPSIQSKAIYRRFWVNKEPRHSKTGPFQTQSATSINFVGCAGNLAALQQ